MAGYKFALVVQGNQIGASVQEQCKRKTSNVKVDWLTVIPLLLGLEFKLKLYYRADFTWTMDQGLLARRRRRPSEWGHNNGRTHVPGGTIAHIISWTVYCCWGVVVLAQKCKSGDTDMHGYEMRRRAGKGNTRWPERCLKRAFLFYTPDTQSHCNDGDEATEVMWLCDLQCKNNQSIWRLNYGKLLLLFHDSSGQRVITCIIIIINSIKEIRNWTKV